MSHKTATFIEDCLEGEAALEDIHEWIKVWHQSGGHRPIHEYLGMKEAEYALWVERPQVLHFIVSSHREGISLKEALKIAAAKPSAAREGSSSAARQILSWLQETGRL